MAEIEQIIDDEFVVCGHLEIAGPRDMRRRTVIEAAIIRDGRRVRRLLAHPDPDQRMAFDDRIALEMRRAGNRAVSVRILDAFSIRTKFNTVIDALHPIARHYFSHRQRCKAMRAAIRYGGYASVFLAEEDDRLVQ